MPSRNRTTWDKFKQMNIRKRVIVWCVESARCILSSVRSILFKEISTCSDQQFSSCREQHGFFYICFSKFRYTNFGFFLYFSRLHTQTYISTHFSSLLEVTFSAQASVKNPGRLRGYRRLMWVNSPDVSKALWPSLSRVVSPTLISNYCPRSYSPHFSDS